MNIVLIGYRGTGKSTVGSILAGRLGMRFFSMDREIVKRAGFPVTEIVARYGWPGFRDLESELARDLSGQDGLIIDTGGGIIERPENIDSLKSNATIFWLKASVDTIVSRINMGTDRPPLISGKSFTEEVAEVLEQRFDRYRSAADFDIDTDGLAPKIIVEKIIKQLNIYPTKAHS